MPVPVPVPVHQAIDLVLLFPQKPNQIRLFDTMPTLSTINGLRVVVYPNDHRPAHVHVLGNGCEAVFHLRCPDGPPDLRENHGFSLPVLNRIAGTVAHELAALCGHWRRIHGYH